MDESPTEPSFNDPRVSEGLKKSPMSIKRSLVYTMIFLILVIIGFIVALSGLVKENSQCVANPFVYGAERVQSSRGEANPICSCDVEEFGTFCACAMANNGQFWFDDKKVYTQNPYFPTS